MLNHLEEITLFKLLEKLMAAIDTLNSNITTLSSEVDQLIAKPAGVPEAQVQAAADAVAAVSVKVVAALAPTA